MSIQDVTNDTLFREWKDITNDIKTLSESNDSKITTLQVDVGDKSTLTTINKTSVVDAINELDSDVGDKSTLTTANTTDLVSAINEIDDGVDFVSADVGDITTLTTTDKTSVVDAINELDSDVGDKSTLNTTNTSSLVDAINELESVTSTVGTKTNLDDDIEGADIVESINNVNHRTNTTIVNNETNHGRYMDETDLSPATPTFNSGILSAYNGTTISAGDQFYNDNSDNGGSGSSLGTAMNDLLTALSNHGRTNLRNGYEFYIAQLSNGTNTSDSITVNSVTYYPKVQNNNIILGRIGDKVTWTAWVRNTSSTDKFVFGGSGIDVYINDTLSNDKTASDGTEYYEFDYIDPSTDTDKGWRKLRMVKTLDAEFDNFFPAIFGTATSGEILEVALPGLFYGNVTIPNHLGIL